jgi:aminoacyl tRNA synthase complex-interacting multifunctional protein 1
MSKLYLDTSADSAFVSFVAAVADAKVEIVSDQPAPSGASIPALVSETGTVSGAYPVAVELGKHCVSLFVSGAEVEKFVSYVLTDVVAATTGDMKANLRALHKLNKEIQPVTFAVKDSFSLGDLALFSVLKTKISNWSAEDRVALVSICRWYDNVQHLPAVAKTLAPGSEVVFSLDLPKQVAKTGAKPEKKPVAEKTEETAAAKKSGSGPEKKADDKKPAAEKKPAASADKNTAATPAAAPSAGPNPDAELHRIDFRVGRIVECAKHPDADSLYVEKIDLGEPTGPRTIVSGLVKFVPLDQMLNRLVIVVANLKPAKLKGIMSAGMVLAASNPDHTHVEILDPPAGAVPGERVTFKDVTGEPDAQLNPKKKIFEEVKPHLHTNAEKVAQYKELTFMTTAGPCTVATLANATLG